MDPHAGAEAQKKRGWRPGARTYASLLLVMLWGASAFNYATPGRVARNGHLKGGDYAHFYIIGRLAAGRRPTDLYDRAVQRREFARTLPDIEPPTYPPFLYAPYFALLFAALSALPYLPSLAVWWVLTTAAYLASCWFVWKRCGHLARSTADLVLFALAYPGFWELFIHGHTTWLALLCFTMIWSASRTDRWILEGFALGVLAYKPQLGIAAFVVTIARRQWRVLLCAGSVVVAAYALALAWFGPGAFGAYVDMIRSVPRIGALIEPDPAKSSSIDSFLTVLGVPSPWWQIIYVIAAMTLCMWLVRIWNRWEHDRAFAALLIVTILIAPHTTIYDLVLLAPALILLVNANLGATHPDRLWPVLYATYFLALTRPLTVSFHFQAATPMLIAALIAVSLSRPEARAKPKSGSDGGACGCERKAAW